METDAEYFRRRATEERTAAGIAKHPAACSAHVAMAERFEELARELDKANAAIAECTTLSIRA